MATVVAVVPDLLFGSNVVGMVRAAGHDCRLTSSLSEVDLTAADCLILDLTADAEPRLAAAEPAIRSGMPTLAFYSHVEADVRTAARVAGVGLIVPRSRMAREGASLVQRLLEGRGATASGPS